MSRGPIHIPVKTEDNNQPVVQEEYNPVIYVFLNKSLHMSAGKAAAQAIHAGIYAVISEDQSKQQLWLVNPHKTVIVLEARDENHIRNISTYLKDRGYPTNTIVDEGVNEIDPHTITALSTGILNKNSSHTRDTFSTFKLYKDVVKLTLEYEK